MLNELKSMITQDALRIANEQIKYTDIGRNKNYAEVKERVKAFRYVFPEYTIATEILAMDDGIVTFKATIMDPDGRVIATGHAQERKSTQGVNNTSHVENCETSAVGRALGNFGIGIEAAFASADEVVNAIKQEQEDLAKAQENPNTTISKKQLQQIIDRCAEDGISKEELCEFVGIGALDEMTIPQMWALLPKWSEAVKKIKILQRLRQ